MFIQAPNSDFLYHIPAQQVYYYKCTAPNYDACYAGNVQYGKSTMPGLEHSAGIPLQLGIRMKKVTMEEVEQFYKREEFAKEHTRITNDENHVKYSVRSQMNGSMMYDFSVMTDTYNYSIPYYMSRPSYDYSPLESYLQGGYLDIHSTTLRGDMDYSFARIEPVVVGAETIY